MFIASRNYCQSHFISFTGTVSNELIDASETVLIRFLLAVEEDELSLPSWRSRKKYHYCLQWAVGCLKFGLVLESLTAICLYNPCPCCSQSYILMKLVQFVF